MVDRARTLVSIALGISVDEVSEDSNSENINGWDSLVVMQLLVLLEEEFNVHISIKDVELLKSVSGVRRLITATETDDKF
jgi:acyl carrier protein